MLDRRFEEQLEQAKVAQRSGQASPREADRPDSKERATQQGPETAKQAPGPAARTGGTRASRTALSEDPSAATKSQLQAANALPDPSAQQNPLTAAQAAASTQAAEEPTASKSKSKDLLNETTPGSEPRASDKLKADPQSDPKAEGRTDATRPSRSAARPHPLATAHGATALAASPGTERANTESTLQGRTDGLSGPAKPTPDFTASLGPTPGLTLNTAGETKPAASAQPSATTNTTALASLSVAHPAQALEASQAGGPNHHNARIETPVHHPEFPLALASEVKLALHAGMQRATIQITPEDLGPIRIEIQMQGLEANIQFEALEVRTRDAVQSSRELLQTMLASEGMALARFDLGTETSGFGKQFLKSETEQQRYASGPGASTVGSVPAESITPTIRRQGLLNLVA
jgi:flagellar hook-length control protein FliK